MDIVVFDLETTGLSPDYHEIIQVAGVRMRGGAILAEESFATYVKPRQSIPTFITEYTGIRNADVRGAPGVVEALRQFSTFAGNAMLIAHNGKRFDIPFIHASCTQNGLPVRTVPFVDSMAFSRKIWGGRGGHGLDAVMSRLRITMDGGRRHDARGDVQVLAEAVRRMWAQLNADYHTCPVECGTGFLPQHAPS